jgi:hypothetical protein
MRFLASLLGLGGISDVIKTNIERIQAPVNKAIDWLISKAVKLAKSIAGLFGGKKKKEDETPETDDPEHDAKVTAGLAAIDTEEQRYLEQGKISEEEAQKVAASVKGSHPVFKSLEVVDGGESWDYSYAASASQPYSGEQKEEGPGEVNIESIWEETLLALPTHQSAKTRLEETSVRHGRVQLVSIFSANNIPADAADKALSTIDKLLYRALQETTGDDLSKRMASVSGVANDALRSAGSSTVVNAHHVQRVAEQPGTFPETRKGRLHIPKEYEDAIRDWVEKNPKHTKSEQSELIAILRGQLMNDRHLNLERPLEEVEMVISTATAHGALHKNEAAGAKQ